MKVPTTVKNRDICASSTFSNNFSFLPEYLKKYPKGLKCFCPQKFLTCFFNTNPSLKLHYKIGWLFFDKTEQRSTE